MSQHPTPSISTRPVAAASRVLPQRRDPVLQPAAPRQPFRVLHTSRAPAQLSLLLRPGVTLR
jgi:hypothetical protein